MHEALVMCHWWWRRKEHGLEMPGNTIGGIVSILSFPIDLLLCLLMKFTWSLTMPLSEYHNRSQLLLLLFFSSPYQQLSSNGTTLCHSDRPRSLIWSELVYAYESQTSRLPHICKHKINEQYLLITVPLREIKHRFIQMGRLWRTIHFSILLILLRMWPLKVDNLISYIITLVPLSRIYIPTLRDLFTKHSKYYSHSKGATLDMIHIPINTWHSFVISITSIFLIHKNSLMSS